MDMLCIVTHSFFHLDLNHQKFFSTVALLLISTWGKSLYSHFFFISKSYFVMLSVFFSTRCITPDRYTLKPNITIPQAVLFQRCTGENNLAFIKVTQNKSSCLELQHSVCQWLIDFNSMLTMGLFHDLK